MEKLDLTKLYKNYYSSKAKPEIVVIEKAQFLSLQGKGDPSSSEFLENLQALYPTAYSLKFSFKSKEKDFVVPKLECLWWFDEKKYSNLTIAETPERVPRSEWEYRLLIRLPEFVKEEDVEKSKEQVYEKKQLALVKKIEFFHMEEGKSVQMLHVGPFDKEPETLNVMAEFMKNRNMMKNGLHHEIYLTNFNTTPQHKLKTILREPIKEV